MVQIKSSISLLACVLLAPLTAHGAPGAAESPLADEAQQDYADNLSDGQVAGVIAVASNSAIQVSKIAQSTRETPR